MIHIYDALFVNIMINIIYCGLYTIFGSLCVHTYTVTDLLVGSYIQQIAESTMAARHITDVQ